MREAVIYLDRLLLNFPYSDYATEGEELWRSLRQQLADHILRIGDFYRKRKEYEAAASKRYQAAAQQLSRSRPRRRGALPARLPATWAMNRKPEEAREASSRPSSRTTRAPSTHKGPRNGSQKRRTELDRISEAGDPGVNEGGRSAITAVRAPGLPRSAASSFEQRRGGRAPSSSSATAAPERVTTLPTSTTGWAFCSNGKNELESAAAELQSARGAAISIPAYSEALLALASVCERAG